MSFRFKEHSVLPGFGPSLGYATFYLSLIVLIPLLALAVRSTELGWVGFWELILQPRVLASYRLTLTTALASAAVNTVFGFLVAWFLVRVPWKGKQVLDTLIDLPFALPTAVSGIALTALYAPSGWLGRLLEPLGVKVAFSPIGITFAMIFTTLPFVVRSIQPTLADLEKELEEAALSLGASWGQTFWRVTLPLLAPSLLTGFALSFARGLGEYGSVVFISGNMPMRTEVSTLLILTKLEQFDYAGATAIAIGMLALSFGLLLLINLLQSWSSRRLSP